MHMKSITFCSKDRSVFSTSPWIWVCHTRWTCRCATSQSHLEMNILNRGEILIRSRPWECRKASFLMLLVAKEPSPFSSSKRLAEDTTSICDRTFASTDLLIKQWQRPPNPMALYTKQICLLRTTSVCVHHGRDCGCGPGCRSYRSRSNS